MACLFCLGEGESTEHIFCEALGHVGVFRDVCPPCNHHLGTTVDIAADLSPVLSTARRHAGLPIRHQAVAHTSFFQEADGRELRTQVSRAGTPEIAPQYENGERIASAGKVPTAIREMVKARFKKASLPFDETAEAFVENVIRRFESALPGDIVVESCKGVTISVPKLTGDDLVTVTWKNDEVLFTRLCYKIALEVAASLLGTAALLSTAYDPARDCARNGGLSPAPIQDIRRPSLTETDDHAALAHDVAVVNDLGLLKTRIAFYRSYVVDVTLGPVEDLALPKIPDGAIRTFEL
jgi:hypothetical protein